MKIENYKLKICSNKGFTLMEVLLAMVVVTILAGFSIPVYRYFQTQNDLNIVRDEIVHSFRRAQILSQAMEDDISWGVDVRVGQITLFKGTSYASRDGNFDEVYDFSNNISFSGLGEIVFEKFTGEPNVTGSVTATSVLGDSVVVTVNGKGMVEY